MEHSLDNPVPYDATAVRPAFETLPPEVRADIAAHLGGDPVTVRIAGGGFTGGFAAVLTSASGDSLFVKAAGPHQPFVVNAYSGEANVNPALPDGIPAPTMRFASQIGEWVALGFDPVRGGVAPRLPFSPDDVKSMLDAWSVAAEALAEPPQALRDLGLPTLADDLNTAVRQFTMAESGEQDLRLLPAELRAHIPRLAELERQLPAAIASNGLTHGDLRPDNMILDGDRAWICDWNWPSYGAAFFDTACLLVVASMGGHDPDALFWTHPTAHGVADEQLDSALAAIAGYYLGRAAEPPIPNVSPHLRAHQRQNGVATLRWLARRRGW